MELLSWTAAAYILLLPSGYWLEAQSVEAVQGPGGPATVLETVCSWKNAASHSLVFHWWAPYPPRPGGPMIAAREAAGAWAAAPATFVETAVFQGAQVRMTVAFQELPVLKGHARIAATDLALENLQTLLGRRQVAERDARRSSQNRLRSHHDSLTMAGRVLTDPNAWTCPQRLRK